MNDNYERKILPRAICLLHVEIDPGDSCDSAEKLLPTSGTCLKSIYGIVSHSIYRISWPSANWENVSRLCRWRGFGFGLSLATSSYVLWLPVDGSVYVCVCMCGWACVYVGVLCLLGTCSLQQNHFYNWHAASQKKLHEGNKKIKKLTKRRKKKQKTFSCVGFSVKLLPGWSRLDSSLDP